MMTRIVNFNVVRKEKRMILTGKEKKQAWIDYFTKKR